MSTTSIGRAPIGLAAGLLVTVVLGVGAARADHALAATRRTPSR